MLLVGALALAGLLAYQAFDANRSHAAAVHKTLGEQAQFAAWEYANTVRRTLDAKVLYLGLDVVAGCGGKVAGAPLSMDTVRAAARAWEWTTVDAVTSVFRLDLASGTVTIEGKGWPGGLERWIGSELRAHFDSSTGPGWQPRMLEGPVGDGFVAYRFAPDDRRDAEVLYGFHMRRGGLDPHFTYSLASSPLLPEGLTGGRPNEEVFAVSMESGKGRTVWAADTRYVSDFEARDTLGVRYAGLTARVVVNPEVAPSLVIGGFPQSRLPLILTLLVLTTGLVAGAFWQLRRETELAQLRADFVSGVSHELRTPLAQIRMFGETLLLDRVRSDEERRRSLEIIVNESQRLTHQVGNVLLYSRSEREAVRADCVETDAAELAEEVAEAFRPLAAAAGHDIVVSADGPRHACIDPGLMRQALLNLLDNAVKYGPAGQTITISVGGNPRMVRFSVADEGEGVPERDSARIWQPYFRSKRHRESSTAGSGIGLSVVREVAEAHGGEARVESAGGGGARFVVEVPRLG
jgi:signal transduction histidine kinase